MDCERMSRLQIAHDCTTCGASGARVQCGRQWERQETMRVRKRTSSCNGSLITKAPGARGWMAVQASRRGEPEWNEWNARAHVCRGGVITKKGKTARDVSHAH